MLYGAKRQFLDGKIRLLRVIRRLQNVNSKFVISVITTSYGNAITKLPFSHLCKNISKIRYFTTKLPVNMHRIKLGTVK
jgi:hypothetical protein